MNYETINHPSHYTDGKIEVIDFIEDKHLNFHKGDAVKYIARAGKKNGADTATDLGKAVWYLNREIQRLTGEERFITRNEQVEIEEYFESELLDEHPELTDEEIEKQAHEKAEALSWVKAIIVYIDLPEMP